MDSRVLDVARTAEPVPEVIRRGTRLKSGMIGKLGTGSFIWPVPAYRHISRWANFTPGVNYHQGVDIAAPYGTEIYAADAGTVVASTNTPRILLVPLRHIREHIPCTEQPLVIIHLKMAVVPEGVAGIAHIAYDLPLLHHVAYVHRLGRHVGVQCRADASIRPYRMSRISPPFNFFQPALYFFDFVC